MQQGVYDQGGVTVVMPRIEDTQLNKNYETSAIEKERENSQDFAEPN